MYDRWQLRFDSLIYSEKFCDFDDLAEPSHIIYCVYTYDIWVDDYILSMVQKVQHQYI